MKRQFAVIISIMLLCVLIPTALASSVDTPSVDEPQIERGKELPGELIIPERIAGKIAVAFMQRNANAASEQETTMEYSRALEKYAGQLNEQLERNADEIVSEGRPELPTASPLPEAALDTSDQKLYTAEGIQKEMQESKNNEAAVWRSEISVVQITPTYGLSNELLYYHVRLSSSTGGSGYVLVGATSKTPPVLEFSYTAAAEVPSGGRTYYLGNGIYAEGTETGYATAGDDTIYALPEKREAMEEEKQTYVDAELMWAAAAMSYLSDLVGSEEGLKDTILSDALQAAPAASGFIRKVWNDVYEPRSHRYYVMNDFVEGGKSTTNHCGPTAGMNLAIYWMRRDVRYSYPLTNDRTNALHGETHSTWGQAIKYFDRMYLDMSCNSWLWSAPGAIPGNVMRGLQTYFQRQGVAVSQCSVTTRPSVNAYKSNIANHNPTPLLNLRYANTVPFHWTVGLGWEQYTYNYGGSVGQLDEFWGKVTNGHDAKNNTYVLYTSGTQYAIGGNVFTDSMVNFSAG